MSDQEACRKIRKLLTSQFRKAFGGNLDDNLSARSQVLWIVGVDAKRKNYIDVCGTIGDNNLAIINAKGFFETDAGYKVNAQYVLGLSGVSVDIFFLNTAHFNAAPDIVEPLVVHELAHMLEESGQMPQAQFNDDANANAILTAYRPDAFKPAFRHNKEWALHLAIGSRTILSKKLTGHKLIRAYLEAAIPHYDRTDGIKATKGWP